MSIKPKYVEKILTGEKTAEFRRSMYSSIKKGDQVFIYSSSPQKALVGKFIIDDIINDTVENLWKLKGKEGCISYGDFMDYYDGNSSGYCLVLKEITTFSTPIKLEELRTQIVNFIVPQSYRYLRPDEIETLKKITPDLYYQKSLDTILGY
jgi:predicted transcriptional regulator